MGRMSRLKSMGLGLSARAKGSQAIVQPVKSSCEKKRYIDGPLIHAASFASRVCRAIPGPPCGEAEAEVMRRNPLPRPLRCGRKHFESRQPGRGKLGPLPKAGSAGAEAVRAVS